MLDEEIGYILDMGVDLKLNHSIDSLKDLLGEGYDAIFVGTGAPRGKNLEIPGRYDSDRIHIGIDWLESVAFEHTKSIGKRVLIIGVGNTAMDCCRTSLRLGRRGRQGHGAQATRLLQGIRLGAGGRRGRKRRDSRQSFTQRSSSTRTASSSA